jgi:protein ImuA
MIRNRTFAALKQRIASVEAGAAPRWPVAPLGADGLDGCLPGGGVPAGTVQDVRPAGPGDFAAALGFGAGLLTRLAQVRPGSVFWVLPRTELFRKGTLYPPGLTTLGVDPDHIIQVCAPKPRDVLWAMEEALDQPSVSAVLGLLPGEARAYDFTASRRLALRAGESGAMALVLQDAAALDGATAAALRWRVAAAPGAGLLHRGQAKPSLGAPRWHIELIKSKRGPTGHWQVEWDHETFSFRMAAPLADRTPLRADAQDADAKAIA